jgi:uncharacterized protein YdeI (YjbR/CyaY-like superfamily)
MRTAPADGVSALHGPDTIDSDMEPTFFPTPADFRAWLEAHYDSESELLVGFFKKGSGRPSITWPESVDQALCFGWIDGVRRSRDADSYTIRFTPRKLTSNWSAINIKRVAELSALGLMTPAGLRAFERRNDDKSAIYSYEQRQNAELGPELEALLRANDAAWEFFEAQASWYQRAATHWVISAKREETRRKRLATLIEDSAAGRRISPLRRPQAGNAINST